MDKNSTSYIPFARKYRPQNFNELLGQEVLTKTLGYCINNKKLATAILITGIRGVGKTSSARIIAKSINCNSLSANNSNYLLPCQSCKNCKSFNKNSHPDIIEIDAASRTSIDDIREIIESSEYRPLLGQYKVFIIDEVHMLSKNAFNGLLKIIEEPPQYVIFIFATTEAQKIPLTILSRCQRYDLKRLSINEILALLEKIANQENLKVEEEALKLIALRSDGSARDAVVILEQVSNYVHNNSSSDLISSMSVNKMLGIVDKSLVLKLIELIIDENAKDALNLFEKIYIDCSNLECFINQVADSFASLTKKKLIPDFEEFLYKEYESKIYSILAKTTLSKLSILWQLFINGSNEVKSSHNELITAEMLIIKAIYSCRIPDVEKLLHDSEPVIESNLNNGVSSENKEERKSILDFLKFCSLKNEMELYYIMMNEVEIRSFVEPVIELITTGKFFHEEVLKSMLLKWSKNDWDIIVLKQDKINSLKQELIKKAKKSKGFSIIKNNFPNANVSDILLK